MIASKATTYEGVTFRSKLEATWAAMFDLLGWPWIYEPEDLGSYIPDFLIRGRETDWYVEVKAPSVWQADQAQIIQKAAVALLKNDLLILTGGFERSSYFQTFEFGNLVDGEGVDAAHLHFDGEHYDFIGGWGSWSTRLMPHYDGNSFAESGLVDGSDILKLWSRARNLNRWMPGEPL